MGMRVFITRLSIILALLLMVTFKAKAQIIGPSVAEVKFSYTTTFQIPEDADEEYDEDRAAFHASHIFGIFASPTMVARLIGADSVMGGIGGPRSQMKIKILS